ncbi:hypothetical protein T265_08471 [Opisthorchis viverrini]|uniref:Uncharacterized protein n=1 Tax=Opisthorchis viverrini TaxID=6198 RepID=A0A074Z931_OPIVI|nr:hypothetical protein T265_08471 [Opisthorchis viverrini]KER23706.1 hypothetical protein T265_08471 [Opisthorchis viverrini]
MYYSELMNILKFDFCHTYFIRCESARPARNWCTSHGNITGNVCDECIVPFDERMRARWPKWLEREFTDRKVRGSNPTSATRLPLSRLG